MRRVLKASAWSIMLSLASAIGAMGMVLTVRQKTVSLHVIARDQGKRGPVTVWLGIRNDTDDAALMCVSSIGASTLSAEGGAHMSASGFSPHACVNDEAYTLVLPHETTYQAWKIPESVKVRTDQRITIQVSVFTKALSVGEGIERETSWTGTPGEMVAAARMLSRKTK
jgi:hypothetical protein